MEYALKRSKAPYTTDLALFNDDLEWAVLCVCHDLTQALEHTVRDLAKEADALAKDEELLDVLLRTVAHRFLGYADAPPRRIDEIHTVQDSLILSSVDQDDFALCVTHDACRPRKRLLDSLLAKAVASVHRCHLVP